MMEALQTSKVLKLDSREQSVAFPVTAIGGRAEEAEETS